jgi:hypothetical protein
MKHIHIIAALALLVTAAHAGSLFTSVTSHYPPEMATQANAALDALEDNLDGTTPLTSPVVKGTLTAISTNGATTNIVVTVGGQLDGSKVADADLGDVSVSSGSWTLDADTVAPAEMADADHGDFTYVSGVASLDADVVGTNEMADADHGDVEWSSGVATIVLDEISPIGDPGGYFQVTGTALEYVSGGGVTNQIDANIGG